MPKTTKTVKSSTYRQRGYKSKLTGALIMVYSDDPAPTPDPGDTLVLAWDNILHITETVEVTPYVEGEEK